MLEARDGGASGRDGEVVLPAGRNAVDQQIDGPVLRGEVAEIADAGIQSHIPAGQD